MRFHKKSTAGELYRPAMEITEQTYADRYFADLMDFMALHGKVGGVAEGILKQNLGYWAGYYDNETRQRVERLFKCAHPVFGSVEHRGAPTPGQALAAGVAK